MQSLRWTVLGCAVILAAALAPNPAACASQDNSCLIVVPERASSTEQFAAEELQRYLRQMSGQEIPVGKEKEAAAAKTIYVGRTQRGRQAAEKIAKADVETLLLSGNDHELVLVGNCDRATLYAVYAFLEHLGCRWVAPGIDHVPPCQDISFRLGEQVQSPGIKYRVLRYLRVSRSSEWDLQCADWAVKNKVNLANDRDLLPQFPAEVEKRGGVRGINSTHVAGYLLTKELYAQHPEIFARDASGKAVLNTHSQQFCFSAEKAVAIYADRLLEYIRAHPDVELFPITQADGTRYCQCADCLKLYGKTDYYDDIPNVSRAWMAFVAKVAGRVNRVYPDKKFYTLAYGATLDPKGIDFKLANIVVVVTHSPSPFDYFHPYTSALKKDFLALCREWNQIAPGGLGVYDYYPFSKFRSLPLVAVEKVAADIKTVHRLGVVYFELQSTTSPGMYLPVYYAGARAMWNPACDIRQEMTSFYQGMYGKSAAHVEQLYQTLEKAREAYPHAYQHDTRATDLADLISYITPEVADRGEALLEKAWASADSTEIQDRLRPVIDQFYYAKHLRRGRDAYASYQASGDVKLLQKAVGHAGEIAKLAEEVGRSRGLRRNLGMLSPGIVKSGREGVGQELGAWRSALKKAE